MLTNILEKANEFRYSFYVVELSSSFYVWNYRIKIQKTYRAVRETASTIHELRAKNIAHFMNWTILQLQRRNAYILLRVLRTYCLGIENGSRRNRTSCSGVFGNVSYPTRKHTRHNTIPPVPVGKSFC